jgi:hypothetical protein
VLVEDRAKIAKQTPVRIGATRKSRGITAAENAGIGWLAASIKHITGQPHIIHACVLAETIFAIGEVSEDRLRGAYRNIDERDWRDVR